MYICVFLHIRLLMEPLTAVLARVGPGVRMYEEMSGKCTGPLESFPTLLAFEDFFYTVDSPVERDFN